MTDNEIKEKIEDMKNNTNKIIKIVKANKISIIMTGVSILIIICGIFLGGFFTARKIYRVGSVDQQILSLQNKLNEATNKLNEVQARYDELIKLNDKMSDQATLIRKDIEDALKIVETSQITINEIKELTTNGTSGINDGRLLINKIMQNNAIIKDKVIVLEDNLEELKAKIIFVPESLK